MAKTKPGRPAGSRNGAMASVTVVPAACPRCKSTDRAAVRVTKERAIAGNAPNGQPRTHIVWRRVRCNSCGQYFTEQEHQNRVGEEKKIENLDSF